MFTKAYTEPMKTPQHVFSSICKHIKDHPGDYPLVSDMTYRSIADHKVDQSTEYFDPSIVKKGDIIYLDDWYIPWFTKYVHPKIKYPYILISISTSGWHPEPGVFDYNEKNGWPPPVEATRTLLYDSKVAAWFGKNMMLSRHPKAFQIPLGQNLIYWGSLYDRWSVNCHKNLVDMSMQKNDSKQFLLYLNMTLKTDPSRTDVAKLFQDKPYCLSRIIGGKHKVIPKTQYFEELASCTFTLAPRGIGMDTVRLWEALLLNCIPIVKHCELDDLYADLPILFIDEWEQINEKFLIEKEKEIKSKSFSRDKAFFDFWANKIYKVQESIRKNKNTFSNLQATKFPTTSLNNLLLVIKKNTKKNDSLICKGAVLGLRPFQLIGAGSHLSKLYVQDKWGAYGNEKSDDHLKIFSSDPLLLNRDKIIPINHWDCTSFLFGKDNSSKTHVFLDLTYIRHNFVNDIGSLFSKAPSKTLFCGNLAEEPYLKRVVQEYFKKQNHKVNFQGDIWFVIKK
ncbi:MAG: hypothetical protein H0W88_04385 [Parachlamydiaceae bacterium]|nr:hypothetical protein [Parachlamydiaceae bacterium]